jgi:hypothetical protein
MTMKQRKKKKNKTTYVAKPCTSNSMLIDMSWEKERDWERIRRDYVWMFCQEWERKDEGTVNNIGRIRCHLQIFTQVAYRLAISRNCYTIMVKKKEEKLMTRSYKSWK